VNPGRLSSRLAPDSERRGTRPRPFRGTGATRPCDADWARGPAGYRKISAGRSAVLGFPDDNDENHYFCDRISKFADLYVVDNKFENPNANHIRQFGVLKDFFAMSDLSFYGSNLTRSSETLHNIVEATSGGPLLMVTPYKRSQYGYQQLKSFGCIVECSDVEDVLQKAFDLKDSDHSNNLSHRAEHLLLSRKKYLPLLRTAMLDVMQVGEVLSDLDDLRIENLPNGIRVMHPETHWDYTINS